MYKLSKDERYIDVNHHRRGRSSATALFKTERPRNTRYLRSLLYEGPKMWQELPQEVKNLDNHLVSTDRVKKVIWADFMKEKRVFFLECRVTYIYTSLQLHSYKVATNTKYHHACMLERRLYFSFLRSHFEVIWRCPRCFVKVVTYNNDLSHR